MAGTVTVTETPLGNVHKVKWSWTSDASGNADKVTLGNYAGEVLALFTDPDGTDVPTDTYDITITDPDGYDVMQGAGANRAAAANQTAVPAAKSVAHGTLTLNVAAAGNAKKGVAILYLLGAKF